VGDGVFRAAEQPNEIRELVNYPFPSFSTTAALTSKPAFSHQLLTMTPTPCGTMQFRGGVSADLKPANADLKPANADLKPANTATARFQTGATVRETAKIYGWKNC
jgi:hypothetical protein